MKQSFLRILALPLITLALCGASSTALAKDKFKVCWTIYVGWMPWGYGEQTGIVKKWAKKYNIDIDVVQINDYVESINQYTAGGFDGCTMTNMDALTIPAVGGVDSTALIVGDFSNGNDAVILKNKSELKDIKGQKVNLVELSVSHYLLARALDTVKLTEKDIKVINTSDADMVATFGTKDVTAVTTWNPLVGEILAMPGAKKVFDSSQIPGEIIDLMVVNTKTLQENPNFGKALVGAWYEILDKLATDKAAKEAMAKASATNVAGFDAQLATTKLFYKPAEAVAFTQSADLKKTMETVAKFSFDHGILGQGAKSPTAIGIQTPAGVYGDEKNIKLRFDPSFMALAQDGKL